MDQKYLGFILSCLLVQSIVSTENDNSLYNLVLHPHDRGAYCLDGSPAGMYLNEGVGQGKNKFLIYFEGGGACGGSTLASTLQSCYQRSNSNLGSTNKFPKQQSFQNSGMLSTDPEKNPVFHDWTKIFIIYCDGATHQGYRESTISYKGKNLYFRGRRNSLEHFYYLDKNYDFYNKDTIVISGTSAGGIGAFAWVQHCFENTKTSKVVAIPDSGIFIKDFESPTAHEKVVQISSDNLLKLIGEQNQFAEPVKKCFQVQGSQADCYDLSHYIKYIQAPIFMIQSSYDQWVLSNLIIVKCVTNFLQPYSISNCNDTMRASIEDYHKIFNQQMQQMRQDKKYLGIWGVACVQHGFVNQKSFTSEKYKSPSTNGLKIYEAIQKFLNDPMNPPWLLDEGLWPSANVGCNGLSHHQIRQE